MVTILETKLEFCPLCEKEHLIEMLYKNVERNLDIKVYSLEEDEFDSLFGTFNADDNPMWK